MPDHVVAYPEKLLKTIATRCAISSLKFTKNRLAAGLRWGREVWELESPSHMSGYEAVYYSNCFFFYSYFSCYFQRSLCISSFFTVFYPNSLQAYNNSRF